MTGAGIATGDFDDYQSAMDLRCQPDWPWAEPTMYSNTADIGFTVFGISDYFLNFQLGFLCIKQDPTGAAAVNTVPVAAFFF